MYVYTNYKIVLVHETEIKKKGKIWSFLSETYKIGNLLCLKIVCTVHIHGLFLHPNSLFSFHHFCGSELQFLADTASYWLRHTTA
jgi:hypothetical protein